MRENDKYLDSFVFFFFLYFNEFFVLKCLTMLTALYARSMQQNHGLFEFSPKLACNVCTYVCCELPSKSAFWLGTLPSV